MYDEETGFYYLRSRYYDPEIGRFLNADGVLSEIGGSVKGYNIFSYCFNNPTIYVDSTGDFPWLVVIIPLIGIGAGAIFGATCDTKLTHSSNTSTSNNTTANSSSSLNYSVQNELYDMHTSSSPCPDNIFINGKHRLVALASAQEFFEKTHPELEVNPQQNGTQELTTMDRITNSLIGGALGGAAGGASVALLSMIGSLCVGSATSSIACLGGATGSQSFAIGALFYNAAVSVISFFTGQEMDLIELE